MNNNQHTQAPLLLDSEYRYQTTKEIQFGEATQVKDSQRPSFSRDWKRNLNPKEKAYSTEPVHYNREKESLPYSSGIRQPNKYNCR